ncbi:hypothetical protein DFJ73DRAFT_779555 [Zopfochytrium polystomum]|nr:hypothetical protein DFJ73DRAFT_779555 [Zopfochytrium polystomum]
MNIKDLWTSDEVSRSVILPVPDKDLILEASQRCVFLAVAVTANDDDELNQAVVAGKPFPTAAALNPTAIMSQRTGKSMRVLATGRYLFATDAPAVNRVLGLQRGLFRVVMDPSMPLPENLQCSFFHGKDFLPAGSSFDPAWKVPLRIDPDRAVVCYKGSACVHPALRGTSLGSTLFTHGVAHFAPSLRRAVRSATPVLLILRFPDIPVGYRHTRHSLGEFTRQLRDAAADVVVAAAAAATASVEPAAKVEVTPVSVYTWRVCEDGGWDIVLVAKFCPDVHLRVDGRARPDLFGEGNLLAESEKARI